MLLSNIEWIFSWAILRYHSGTHWDHMNISIIMFLLSLVVGPKVQPVGYQYRLYLYYVYWLHAYIIHCWHGWIFYKIFYLRLANSVTIIVFLSLQNQHHWKLSQKSKSSFAKRYYDFLQTIYCANYWLVYQCAYVGGWLMDNCFVTGRLMIFQWTVTVFSIVTGIWKLCSTLSWWWIQDKIKTGPLSFHI